MRYLILLLLLSSTLVFSQGNNTTLLGHWGYGPTNAFAHKNDTLLLGSGCVLVALDITNPASAQKIGGVTMPNVIQGIFVKGNLAYVATLAQGLRIIDISNLSDMKEIGAWESISRVASGVAVIGNHAFLAHNSGIVSLDVSDSTNPTPVSYYDVSKDFRRIVTDNKFLYVVEDQSMWIVNPANPAALTGLGTYFATTIKDVAVQGNYAYLLRSSGGMSVIDISDSSNPASVGTYSTSQATRLTVSGNYAYIGNGEDGLRVIDISNPASPTRVGSYSNVNDAADVTLIGSTAIFVDKTRNIKFLNVGTPTSPALLGSYALYGSSLHSVVSGNYLYIANGTHGLVIVDVTDKNHPVEVGNYDTPGITTKVVVNGSYAYLADGVYFRIINISNPASPSEVGSLNLSGTVYEIAVQGTLAYIANSYNGLKVVNTSNPASPSVTGTLDTPGNVLSVAVKGTTAFITDADANGLKTVNITNPASPTFITTNFEFMSTIKGIRLINDSIYAFANDEIYYFTGDDPVTMQNHGGCTISYVNDVAGDLSYTYGASSRDKLRILLKRSSDNAAIASYYTPGSCKSITLGNGFVYISDGDAGVEIIKNMLITGVDEEGTEYAPSAFALHQNYPNPFNPVTTISYSLKQSSFVSLKIYNILGEEVATLVNEAKQSGVYSVNWNAVNVPSGLYYYQLNNGETFQTKTMLLMK